MKKEHFKGLLFELFILLLVQNNGYKILGKSDDKTKKRIRENRSQFVELKGRGDWHQIDLPFDYAFDVPFIYPIRLLGEVKYITPYVDKPEIRELIGVIKDIQENYFVDSKLNSEMILGRRTEVGVIFSANGFSEGAEKLAYCHDIRTISYENNLMVENIKIEIDIFADYIYDVKKYDENKIRNIYRKLKKSIINYLMFHSINGKSEYIINYFINQSTNIKSNFFATTKTGYIFHFLGENQFPESVFNNSDVANCRVYYENNYNLNDNSSFYITINNDITRTKFYFSAPKILDESVLFGIDKTLNEKERMFSELNIITTIYEKKRLLTLNIDNDWINSLRLHLKDSKINNKAIHNK